MMFRSIHHFIAMVLWGFPLVCSTPTRTSDHPDDQLLLASHDHSHVFEVMAVTILILLGTNCWLWWSRPLPHAISVDCRVCSDVDATKDVSESHQSSVKKRFLSVPPSHESGGPDFCIYFTQHGKCWHLNRACGHLKRATTKVNSLAPCQTCAASFHPWRTQWAYSSRSQDTVATYSLVSVCACVCVYRMVVRKKVGWGNNWYEFSINGNHSKYRDGPTSSSWNPFFLRVLCNNNFNPI